MYLNPGNEGFAGITRSDYVDKTGLIGLINRSYLSADKWDGPQDLHDMLDVKDKGLLRFIPNYPINLIAPYHMKDEDFDKFSTDLGLAMKVLKYQKSGAVEVIKATDHRKVDRNTAVFLNRVANLGLEFDEKEDSIDMCKAMDENNKKMKITGAVEMLRLEGATEEDIIAKVMKLYNVTKEYVLAILKAQVA